MFTALSAVKFVVSGVVGIGTGKIVSAVVKDHVNPETLIDKISMAGATWAMGGVAAQATKKFTNEAIDDIYKGVTETWAELKLKSKLTKISLGETTFEAEGLNPADYHRGEDGVYVFIGEKSDGFEGIVTEEKPAEQSTAA